MPVSSLRKAASYEFLRSFVAAYFAVMINAFREGMRMRASALASWD
jgi:hypothetical protein